MMQDKNIGTVFEYVDCNGNLITEGLYLHFFPNKPGYETPIQVFKRDGVLYYRSRLDFPAKKLVRDLTTEHLKQMKNPNDVADGYREASDKYLEYFKLIKSYLLAKTLLDKFS